MWYREGQYDDKYILKVYLKDQIILKMLEVDLCFKTNNDWQIIIFFANYLKIQCCTYHSVIVYVSYGPMMHYDLQNNTIIALTIFGHFYIFIQLALNV